MHVSSMLQQGFVVLAAILLARIIIQQRSATAYAAQVIVSPGTIVALVDPNKTAQFSCEVEGVGVDWFLNGTHETQQGMDDAFEGVTYITTLTVSENGSALFSSYLLVPMAEEFDNMSIVCRARGQYANESQDSDVAWLKLEAPLVAPYIIQLNATQTAISISWNCTVAQHTEIFYNITIAKINAETLVLQIQETELSFGLDHPFAELCTNYTFSVVAWSELDTSDPSEPVTAGFHCHPMPTEVMPISLPGISSVVTNIPASEMYTLVPELQMPSFSLAFVISVTVPTAIIILMLILIIAVLLFLICYMSRKAKSSGASHEGSVVMKENAAYQMVKISHTGRDMNQCPA